MSARPSTPDAIGAGVPGWRGAGAGIHGAGQPAPADWARLAAAGLRSVINLRPAGEQPDRDEAGEVAAAGLEYRHLPIAGADDLDREAAAALHGLLRDLPRPLLVHCASGNRVGALIALREAWFNGAGVEAAIARGRDAGLAGLEPQVRQRLAPAGR